MTQSSWRQPRLLLNQLFSQGKTAPTGMYLFLAVRLRRRRM